MLQSPALSRPQNNKPATLAGWPQDAFFRLSVKQLMLLLLVISTTTTTTTTYRYYYGGFLSSLFFHTPKVVVELCSGRLRCTFPLPCSGPGIPTELPTLDLFFACERNHFTSSSLLRPPDPDSSSPCESLFPRVHPAASSLTISTSVVFYQLFRAYDS